MNSTGGWQIEPAALTVSGISLCYIDVKEGSGEIR